MSSTAEEYNRIERYLQGAMLPGELDEFNEKLANDPQLAASVSLHRELAETLAGEGVHQFRRVLQRVDAEWKFKSGGSFLRIVKSPRILAIAASMLLLIGFFAWLGLQGPSPEALAMDSFEQLPLETQMSSYEDEIIPLRNQASQAYIGKDYAEAARLFLELARLEPANTNHKLLAGISQLGAQQAETAIGTLRPLADGSDEQVNMEASWYLALAFLQAGETTSAQTYLNKVAANQGFNAAKAAELLKALE
ncbi:MAG: hypothetical protein R2824_21075 [Saprospiraceae bacterium]|nr:hypothetical protein [Lewinella sp.]